MKNIKKLSLALLCVLPLSGMALQNGVALSYGNLLSSSSSSPNGIHGFNVAYTMQPDSWSWYNNNLALSLNFSYGYWKTTDYSSNQSLSTFAAAPTLRWYFLSNPNVTPFLQGSVGPAYLTNTYIGNRNLGSSLEFQDILGIGAAFGAQRNFYAALDYMHYSNAGLSSSNDGMDVPLMITVGYQF